MTMYEFVDKLLAYLELGSWNGNRIMPRGLLSPQEQVLLWVTKDSLRDWRRKLSGQERQLRDVLTAYDLEDFRWIQHEHFSLLREKYTVAEKYSPLDLVLAELMMLQSLRLVKEKYLELI